jgi:cell division protein FtsB
MKNQLFFLQEEIASLNVQQQSKIQEIKLLSGNNKDSKEYLSFIARNELHFVKDNDVLLVFNITNTRSIDEENIRTRYQRPPS